MSAPNTPRATLAPRRSSSAHTASYAGSLTGPGRPRPATWGGALPGLAVQGELADHEHRGAGVGERLLLASSRRSQILRAVHATSAGPSPWVTPR